MPHPAGIRYAPGLDGVRALAVAAVVTYHLGTTGDQGYPLRGGFLGWSASAQRLRPRIALVMIGAWDVFDLTTPTGRPPSARRSGTPGSPRP